MVQQKKGNEQTDRAKAQLAEETGPRVAHISQSIDWMDQIVEEARKRGDFDNLAGKGKPLRLGDDDPFAGPDAQAYKILKEAGFVPEWVELRNQIIRELNWIRANPTDPLRPSRIVETNVMIDKHNRQIPNAHLALPKLPRTFGQDS